MSERDEFNLNDPTLLDLCDKLVSPDGGGNWNRGNVLKYLAGAGWDAPEKEVQDLRVAAIYLQREIDRVIKRGIDKRPSKIIDDSSVLTCQWCYVEMIKVRDNDNGIRFTCPNGHCEMERLGNRFVEVRPISVENGDTGRCSVCQRACVKSSEESGGVWHCPVGHQSSVKRCPVCELSLTPSSVDSGVYYCHKDHGWYDSLSNWNGTNGVPVKLSPYRCPVCNSHLTQRVNDPWVWGCEGRGHGTLTLSENNSVGVWQSPTMMHVFSDKEPGVRAKLASLKASAFRSYQNGGTEKPTHVGE